MRFSAQYPKLLEDVLVYPLIHNSAFGLTKISRDGGLTVMTKYENIMHNRHIIGYHGCADVHQSSSMVK